MIAEFVSNASAGIVRQRCRGRGIWDVDPPCPACWPCNNEYGNKKSQPSHRFSMTSPISLFESPSKDSSRCTNPCDARSLRCSTSVFRFLCDTGTPTLSYPLGITRRVSAAPPALVACTAEEGHLHHGGGRVSESLDVVLRRHINGSHPRLVTQSDRRLRSRVGREIPPSPFSSRVGCGIQYPGLVVRSFPSSRLLPGSHETPWLHLMPHSRLLE